MSLYYRRDGTPYPEGLEGMLEFAKDFEDIKKKIVKQTRLENGVFISTVWVGIDHNFGGGRPLIFETMVFHGKMSDLDCVRYSKEDEARLGHKMMVKRWKTYKTAEGVLA